MERELKMLAGDEVDVTGVEHAVEGLTAGAPTVRRLTAHYYDTATLSLARSGLTLRHRVGEGPGTWTLKLPVESAGSALARTELDLPGSVRTMPTEFRLLVAAHVRHDSLARVATVVTDRTDIPLSDATQVVAVLTDDRVQVRGPARGRARFREVEVELAASWHGDVLAPVEAWLTERGCTPERPPQPKLVRALGDAATAPPDVAPMRLGKKSSLTDLLAAAIAGSTRQLIDHHAGVAIGTDIEDVHRFRVGTRRLRSDLRTFRRFVDPSWLLSVREELAWLADEVGAVRDLDVLGLRLRSQLERLTTDDALALEPVVLDVGRQRSDAHRHLRETLVGERYLSLLDALVVAAAQPPLAAGLDGAATARDVVRAAVRQPWKKLADAADAITSASADESLHATRILAKRARYASEAVEPVFGADARALARRIASVQDVLGDHQDTVVAEGWLRAAVERWPEARLALGQLIGFERADRERLRTEFDAVWTAARRPKLRAWLKG